MGNAIHTWERNPLCPTHLLPLTQASNTWAKSLGVLGHLKLSLELHCLLLFLSGFPLPAPKYRELQTKGAALGLRHS